MEKVEYVEDGVNEGYGEWSPEDGSSWDNQNIYPFTQYWTNAQLFRNTIHPDSGNQFENLGNDCLYGIASKPETGKDIEQRCYPQQEQFFEDTGAGNQFENLGNDCLYGIASKPETGEDIEQRCYPQQEQFFEECQKHVTKVARENKGHRFRTLYTFEQILELEKRFILSKYITGNDRIRFAEKLGLSEKQDEHNATTIRNKTSNDLRNQGKGLCDNMDFIECDSETDRNNEIPEKKKDSKTASKIVEHGGSSEEETKIRNRKKFI
ncbi:hypothetical protein JTB14_001130 [Gonioctena quinquepunctata]|nr:hypothetical protein JTB14_001130 [Gonioctena quinquepunctata]